MTLQDYKTVELCDELEKRIGVETVEIEPYAKYTIRTEHGVIEDTGPAVIYIVID